MIPKQALSYWTLADVKLDSDRNYNIYMYYVLTKYVIENNRKAKEKGSLTANLNKTELAGKDHFKKKF